MISSPTEGCSTGDYRSLGSLVNPRREVKSKRDCCSQPFIKPYLKLRDQTLAKIFKRLRLKKGPPKNQPQIEFSIEDSRCILKDLAAELDTIFQLRRITLVSGVSSGEINEEEGETLILEWADEIKSLQQTSKQEPMKVPEEQKSVTDQQESKRSDIQQRLNDGKRILCDWIRKSKHRSQYGPRLNISEDHKSVINDLCKQWKKGQLTNMLPVMDFIMRILLQDKCEESILKLWFKTEHKFKKGGDVRIPAPVWKCIIKSSAEVILDPNTANPTLMLSQDGRTIRTKTHEESPPWFAHQRKPHQYDGWPCVQAKEGYSTGRHYWEVDVNGKCDWRLGVVKASAPRCGFVNMNTTAGYWSLRLQLGCLMAMTDPVTKLNQANPSRIGVYLDIEEGHLSFYDTGKRKHIYTFNTDFSKSENIYPVFGTVETNRPLKII